MSLLDGREERSLKHDKKEKKESVFIDGREGREEMKFQLHSSQPTN